MLNRKQSNSKGRKFITMAFYDHIKSKGVMKDWTFFLDLISNIYLFNTRGFVTIVGGGEIHLFFYIYFDLTKKLEVSFLRK